MQGMERQCPCCGTWLSYATDARDIYGRLQDHVAPRTAPPEAHLSPPGTPGHPDTDTPLNGRKTEDR